MLNNKKRLGDLLVELGYITEEQVLEAIKVQKTTGKRLGRIFVELGYITEDGLLDILELQLGIPKINLDLIDIDMNAVSTISEGLAKKYNLIPVGFKDGKLVVAMSDPLNIFAEEDVMLASGYKIDIRIARGSEINDAITKYYSKDYMSKTEVKLNEVVEEDIEDEPIIESEEDSPTVVFIDRVIENAIKNNASDIHIEPYKDKIVIRYRIDGKLKKQFEAPKEPLNSMVTRIKLLSGMDIAERRLPQDGKFVIKMDKKEVDLRVSILPSITFNISNCPF